MGKAIVTWTFAVGLLLFGISEAAAYGTITWTVLSGKTVKSSPALGPDGTIYFGCNDKYVYAYTSDGSQKWSFLTGDFVTSHPVVGAGGTVYIGSGDRQLYALSPDDGSKKWEFATGLYFGIANTPLALGRDGTILVGSLVDNKYLLTALNPDGATIWERQMPYGFGAIVIGGDDSIYLADYHGINYLLALTPDGGIKWQSSVPGSSPAIGADGTIYLAGIQGRLYALHPDGSIKWEFYVGQKETSLKSPVIGPDGTIYVGSEDQFFSQAQYNKLYALNPDGSMKWEFQTPHGIDQPPAIGADGKIYLAAQGLSYNGKLYGLYPDGSMEWEFTSEGFIYTAPTIGNDGSVYVGSLLRGLRAISSSSPGVADSPWPIWQHDVRHTGRSSSWPFRSSPFLDLLLGY